MRGSNKYGPIIFIVARSRRGPGYLRQSLVCTCDSPLIAGAGDGQDVGSATGNEQSPVTG